MNESLSSATILAVRACHVAPVRETKQQDSLTPLSQAPGVSCLACFTHHACSKTIAIRSRNVYVFEGHFYYSGWGVGLNKAPPDTQRRPRGALEDHTHAKPLTPPPSNRPREAVSNCTTILRPTQPLTAASVTSGRPPETSGGDQEMLERYKITFAVSFPQSHPFFSPFEPYVPVSQWQSIKVGGLAGPALHCEDRRRKDGLGYERCLEGQRPIAWFICITAAFVSFHLTVRHHARRKKN